MPTDTFGGRLKEALSNWGQSHHAFSRRLEELDIKGASYRSVVNYMGNRTSPSKFWIRHAADILGVSESWLIDGEGQMLPGETEKKPDDPNFISCIWALDSLKPHLATTTHISTFTQLMLARDRFEDVYGSTRGMSGADAKQAYAKHLLLPLKTLLLHLTGSDQIEDIGPEVIRQALGHYLELVLLLMPAQGAVSDEARKAVSRSLSQWRTQKSAEVRAVLETGVRSVVKAKPKTEED